MPAARTVLLPLFVLVAACSDPAATRTAPVASEPVAMKLPDDDAGRVIRRSIDAAGGWDSWQRRQDAEFVATLTIFAPDGEVNSETIFMHRILLHRAALRVDSIGLIEEVIFGFDGEREWMLRGGRAVTSVSGTAFTRFHAMADALWFGLPFVLAERPVELSYLGPEVEVDKQWERVRVAFNDAAVPADWMVLYFDPESGLIDRVHARITAEFLAHPLWIGRMRDYRDVGGLRKERRRFFYPADPEGKIVGALAAEELVEHVRFNSGLAADLFSAPLAADGGSPAG
jgi:hypothetical protein